jgi:hypothetical protein
MIRLGLSLGSDTHTLELYAPFAEGEHEPYLSPIHVAIQGDLANEGKGDEESY